MLRSAAVAPDLEKQDMQLRAPVGLGPLPDALLKRDEALVPPEAADAEERVGTLEQAAGDPGSVRHGA